jgi:uncharacterized SAM-binding protein YcdF (DUF218 family)
MKRAGVLAVICGVIALFVRGGELIVSPDPLPAHADALLVLAGSPRGEQARRAEAMRLLRAGYAAHLALSVAQDRYGGAAALQRRLEREYGRELALRTVLCPQTAETTLEEARAVHPCLERQGWRSVVVVTSNYHTRRARQAWRRATERAGSPIFVSVHGASDGEFEPQGWWRQWRYARTFVEETTKLAVNSVLE